MSATSGTREASNKLKEVIDEITQLENLTYDLHGLTMTVASQFETHVELSPEADPKNPYARMISQSAINSLVYLVQRSAEIAEELNSRLHEAIQRLPSEQLVRADAPNQRIDESRISDLCRAVKVVSSVVADQLAHPKGPSARSDYGLEVTPFDIDAGMMRYAVDHAAELALGVQSQLRAQ